MTILKKDRVLEVISGSPGQKYIPASPGRPGGYTTTPITLLGCIPTPEAEVVEPAFRLATYQEIKYWLMPSYLQNDKCAVAKKQMELCRNTPSLFTNLANAGLRHFMAVGHRPYVPADVGIVIVEKSANVTVKPNPAYSPTWWNFNDHYTCSVVNGVEKLEPK